MLGDNMSTSETIIAVIHQLREIFLEKHELKGYDDWNAFFGCINALEKIVEEENQKTAKGG